MTIYLDVTSLLKWNRPPVGIVRTVLECAREFVNRGNERHFSLCSHDKSSNRFLRLSGRERQRIKRLLGGDFTDPRDRVDTNQLIASIEPHDRAASRFPLRALSKSLVYCIDPIVGGCVRGWIFDKRDSGKRVELEFRAGDTPILSQTADAFRQDLFDAGMADGHCSFVAPIRDMIDGLSAHRTSSIELYAKGRKPALICKLKINRDLLAAFENQDAVETPPEIITLGEHDVYISAGLDWDEKDFAKIYALKKARGFKLVGFCYDLIPVKYPHLCVGDVASFFSKYFADLSWCADHIVCISERSRSDYLEFISRAGCKAPTTSVVRLGSRMENSADTSPVSREIATLAKQKYLLFVSTIERRKNHEVLYRAYTRLVDAGIANLPLLIFVGMRGWGVSDLLSDISLDPRTKPHIRILESVSDAELTILYQNAFFTLFPSLYEGWGLPVAEALALGKYCLASNQGAIPEIAGDLLDYIDPWNVSDWTAAILELIGTPSRLQAKEKEIRDRFRPDDWKTCVKQIIDAANGTLNLAAATTN